MKNKGFTLIELLVVIAIIAILVAFTVSNFLGARQRAKDVRKKAELQQLKTSLRLYYNDYTIYPASNSTTVTNTLYGCGDATTPPPVSECVETCASQFAVGDATDGCSTVFMKLLPPATDYVWSYAQVNSGDDFCLFTVLDNGSDAEIVKSHAKCDLVCPGVSSTAYVLCAD